MTSPRPTRRHRRGAVDQRVGRIVRDAGHGRGPLGVLLLQRRHPHRLTLCQVGALAGVDGDVEEELVVFELEVLPGAVNGRRN